MRTSTGNANRRASTLGARLLCRRSARGIALLTTLSVGAACRPAPASEATALPARLNLDPRVPLDAAGRHWVDSTLASLTLRQRVGQMVMVWTLGAYENAHDSAYAEVVRWVEQDGIGGVSMSLGTPMEVAAKLNDLQRRAKVPLLVSADLEPSLGRLEGGLFSHYLLDAGSATVFPPQMAIAATGREDDAYDVGRAIAEEGRAVGIQVNFAPVVDVNNNPSNPVINTRSFGEDARRVARLSALFVRGTRDGGALATAKHFPGHGDTDVDSHVGLPVVSATMQRLDSLELVPFRAAIDAGAALVMTAHIALPAVQGDNTPATLSPRVITGLLRDSLRFSGTTITDALTMEGVGKGYTVEQSSVAAVLAGDDILLKPSDPTRAINAVVAAVERGEISRARIDSAARHILELKARAGIGVTRLVSPTTAREVVGSPAHRALAAGIAGRAITLLRDKDHLLPLRPGAPRLVVQYMPETELKAGRVLTPAFRGPGTRMAKIGPGVTRETLDSIGRMADSGRVVVVATYVRRVEGEGRFAIPAHIADWINGLASRSPVVVLSFGNPYLIRQFPNVGSYLVTYGVSDDLERAAANAVLGRADVGGRVPVSLPGFFRAGDGLTLTARR